MKLKSILILFAVGLVLITAGCQTMSSGPVTIPAENSVSISQNQNSGKWQGNYLMVDYKYNRSQGGLDLTGTVLFNDNMTYNFTLLRDFRLGVQLLDANGRVLETRGLTTSRGTFDPIPFRSKLAIPPQVVSISFTYQGTAIEGGSDDGGGITHFWQ